MRRDPTNFCLADIRGGDKSIIDDALQKKKLKRNIIVRIPHFLTAANVVANSDMIMTLPYRLGLFLSQQDRYVLLAPPINLPELPIYLYWHLRNQHNPLHQWVRKTIRELIC